MLRFVAFLRAINVGGRHVKMTELKALFSELGFTAVETVLASGNVVFSSRTAPESALVREIEGRLQDALGYPVATFLRTDTEIAAIHAHRPFTGARLSSATALNIGLLAAPLSATQKRSLSGLTTEIDDFQVHGRQVYWLCQRKQSESTFSNALLEGTLGIQSTFRTARTLARLAERYPPAKRSESSRDASTA
jgi:uncharacterized protein (DUF1697 family)